MGPFRYRGLHGRAVRAMPAGALPGCCGPRNRDPRSRSACLAIRCSRLLAAACYKTGAEWFFAFLLCPGRFENAVRQAAAQLVHKDPPHFFLLLFNGLGGVDYVKSHLFGHGFIFLQDATLEDAKALFDIAAEVEIHSSFVIFQAVAPAQHAAKRPTDANAQT